MKSWKRKWFNEKSNEFTKELKMSKGLTSDSVLGTRFSINQTWKSPNVTNDEIGKLQKAINTNMIFISNGMMNDFIENLNQLGLKITDNVNFSTRILSIAFDRFVVCRIVYRKSVRYNGFNCNGYTISGVIISYNLAIISYNLAILNNNLVGAWMTNANKADYLGKGKYINYTRYYTKIETSTTTNSIVQMIKESVAKLKGLMLDEEKIRIKYERMQ